MTFLRIIVALLTTGTGVFAATYPADKVNLENYCGGTVTLPCPYSQGSAGTIRFYVMPTTACRVKITTYSSCGNYGDNFAIYFNIRYSFMPRNAEMEIYDTSVSRTLEKQWSGSGYSSEGQYSNPTSAGQVLSRYASRPEMSVEFTPDSLFPPSGIHEVYFDYVIVEGQYSYYSTFCTALNGYVNDDFICDTTEDRVNCPSTYNDLTYSMDAALGRQYCESGAGLSGVAIAGIAIGCVAFIGIIVGTVACVACCKRRSWTTEAQTVAFTNNNYTAAPSVTITTPGAPLPYPTQAYVPDPPQGNVAMYPSLPVDSASQKQ